MSHPIAVKYLLVIGGLLSGIGFLGLPQRSQAADWPQWRGPQADGTSPETGLPTEWSATSGIAWKAEIPAWGTSTPVVAGEAVFLTSHLDEQQLVLVKLDRRTGRLLWTRQVGTATVPRSSASDKSDEERRHQMFNELHNLASPSPATDGEVVVVHFGNGDLAAYDYEGQQLWHRNLQEDYGPYTIWEGHANSPLLYQDLVISCCIQDTLQDLPEPHATSYVVAHNKLTGEAVWKTPRLTEARKEPCDSYTTPILWQQGGRPEVLVFGGQMLDAYSPRTGQQLWYLPNLIGGREVSSPLATPEMIYVVQGYHKPLLAVRPAGDGERSRSEIVWKYERATPDSPTPTAWGDLLFMVNEAGIATCLDAQTGKARWTQRLGGEHRASPLAAEGRVYFLNAQGQTTVVAASAKFEKLAENQLDDETIASPIAAGGTIFIRGRKTLYCLGQ